MLSLFAEPAIAGKHRPPSPDPENTRTVLLSGPCPEFQWYALRREEVAVTIVSCAKLPMCVVVDPYTPPVDAYYGRVLTGDAIGTSVGPDVPMVEFSGTVEEMCPPAVN
jgi:hypothetical protein